MADASLGFEDLPQVEAQQASALAPLFDKFLGMRQQNLAELSYMPPISNPADRSELVRLALDPQGLQRASTLALGFAPNIIRGFHGTPHTFDPLPDAPFGAFRDEAIGSGEGAQAYGWGHYVAGNPKVAEGYQKNLSRDNQGYPTLNGENYWNLAKNNVFDPEHDLFHSWQAMKEFSVDADIDAAMKRLNSRADYNEEFMKDNPWSNLRQETNDARGAANWLDANREHISYKEPDEGHLLEVHILPDEHELLDWDKSLSEQPKNIQQKLSSFLKIDPEILQNPDRDPSGYGQVTGANIYQQIAADLSPGVRGRTYSQDAQAASQALHEAGIPGIKYLDAGSRNAGYIVDSPLQSINGMKFPSESNAHYTLQNIFKNTPDQYKLIEEPRTHNYVIFHPSNLRIVGRDGQRLTPVEGDPFGDASH